MHEKAKYCKFLVALCMLLSSSSIRAQVIGNYVGNGSFEQSDNCNSTNLSLVKYWSSIDSSCLPGVYLSVCNGLVPLFGLNSQYPRTGNAHMITTMYYPYVNTNLIGYPKNRLKSKLLQGHTYCVRFYINICETSTYAIDGFGAYFGDETIDTIQLCQVPLTFLNPQVKNPLGNIITDTIGWTAITGTFTANGTEKFLLLGNFLANNVVSTQTLNPLNLPGKFTDVCIDDVSCIEVNLPAYAGRDTTIYLGDSAYIGREPDFALDSGCVWYRLPNTTAIDTISGMWVKPNAIGSYTYVVRQELECSSLKWDTVIVTVREYDVGIRENTLRNWQIEISPNPADDKLTIKSGEAKLELSISIFDITGREVFSKQVTTENFSVTLGLDLPNGVYLARINNTRGKTMTKKLLISK